jgi:hypothetical protein
LGAVTVFEGKGKVAILHGSWSKEPIFEKRERTTETAIEKGRDDNSPRIQTWIPSFLKTYLGSDFLEAVSRIVPATHYEGRF